MIRALFYIKCRNQKFRPVPEVLGQVRGRAKEKNEDRGDSGGIKGKVL